MRPQLPVSLRSLFTDNHPSLLLLPRPTNKAINVSLAVSCIYKLYPPRARHPLRVDSLTPDWARMVSFGRGTNVPSLHKLRVYTAGSWTLELQILFLSISPSCPVPWGTNRYSPVFTQQQRRQERQQHHTWHKAGGEKKERKEWVITRGKCFFCFPVKLASLVCGERRGCQTRGFSALPRLSFHFTLVIFLSAVNTQMIKLTRGHMDPD